MSHWYGQSNSWLFLNNCNWCRHIVFFLCPSNETSVLLIEKKNISKEGKVSLWQKQETSSGDAGSIFFIRMVSYAMSSFQRGKALTKNLYVYIFLGAYTEKECILCGAYETPSEGNTLTNGRKASNWSLLHDLDPPHRSLLVSNYLAKNSVTYL